MRDLIYIGPSPCDEECEQVGHGYRPEIATLECRLFIEQIRRALGPEPEGAALAIKREAHDFGYYVEVVCYYDDAIPASMHYATRAESESPAKWDLFSLAKLPDRTVTVMGGVR